MNEEPFTDVTDEEDLNLLAVQYLALKENERALKRNISVSRRRLKPSLMQQMYHAETSTHITRTLYDQQTLYNKEEFT